MIYLTLVKIIHSVVNSTLLPIALSNSHRPCWIDELSANQAALQAISISFVNISQIVARQFQSVLETRWLSQDVEGYVKTTLFEHATTQYSLSTPLLAISNIGILFKPILTINYPVPRISTALATQLSLGK